MLSKTSFLMDVLRVPTIAGLALGLHAITRAAFAVAEPDSSRNQLKATIALRS
jgi:hypothetical protein